MTLVIAADIAVTKRRNSGHYNNESLELRSLDEYDSFAQRCIAKYASNTAAACMLNSEDAIDYVRTEIMEADCKFDASHGCTRAYFLISNAKYAIFRWLKRLGQTPYEVSLNMTLSEKQRHQQLYTTIPDDKTEKPDDIVADKEQETAQSFVMRILTEGCLSDTQRQCIYMQYIDDLTQAEIARRLNISREAVRQNVNRGLNNLRNQYADKE